MALQRPGQKTISQNEPEGLHAIGTASLIIALVLVSAIFVLSYRAWDAIELRSWQMAVTQQVVENGNGLLSALKDAETGQRGFLLTDKERYLESYRRARLEIPKRLNALVEIGKQRPNLRRRIATLEPLIQKKLDELELTINLRRTKGLESAIAVVQNDHGQEYMDEIRESCTAMQTAAYAQLAEYSAQAQDSANQLGMISTIGGVVLFLLLLFSTISIRRGIRQTHEARDWLRTTLASIGDGVIATDGDGNVTFLNRVAAALTGWSEEEAKGVSLDKIFVIHNEETGAPAENPATRALREGRVVGLANHTELTTKSGRKIPIDDSAGPIHDPKGKVVGVVLVFRDISERREVERVEKATAAEMARHAELLELANAELRQFAHGASHDLREPLRTISMFTAIVRRESGAQLSEKSARSLEFVADGARRMGKLIDALLDYSRASEAASTALSPVQTEEVLKVTIENLGGAIQENKAVITYDSLPVIVGDEIHVNQIFQNLISNALKYRGAEDPRIHIEAKLAGNQWRFSVADNGQGIAPQFHGKIFELFHRLHDQSQAGAGLGLSICKKIVERYGGRIWVESESGKGATFFFTLPAYLPAA